MDLKTAQEKFLNVLEAVNPQHLETFLRWAKCSADDALDELELPAAEKAMEMIKEDIRSLLPQDATQPTEHINFPTSGENMIEKPEATVHVDAFLYPDSVVDALVEANLMSRNYCESCGSRRIAPLNFITHSVSGEKLKYIFQYLIPNLSKNAVVLDVGSRVGAVLYGAYHYSTVKKIIGVEINAEFCQVQDNVIEKFKMDDRIIIKHGDIRSEAETLKEADVIILHNVFEFFLPQSEQKEIWNFLRDTVKRTGVFLVIEPSLERISYELQMDLDGWVRKADVEEMLTRANMELFGDPSSEDSDLGDINLYQVL